MPVAIVRATYTEEKALSEYLVKLFGWGKCDVIWKRGRFQCRIPQQLRKDQIDEMHRYVYFTHYDPL